MPDTTIAPETETTRPLDDGLLQHMHAWWRAANYLTIAQIYLRDNPLLREPLRREHIKPRLLGHWGTSPGLSMIYVHLNRLIRERDADVIYLAGPGHGGPAILANLYLEGTYSEIYPTITQDEAGLLRLLRQFSTPGGVPSHVGAPTPGSIHEGGELGYVLVHAFGAAFDNPGLIVAAVVGDGEAETGPLAGSWQGIRFLHPVRDGAVLPILHLNGHKISGPTVLGRQGPEHARQLIEAHGYHVHIVDGDDPQQVHRRLAEVLDLCHAEIREIQAEARTHGVTTCPRWPAIVLRTPKGWTGPRTVDGLQVEGTFRSHQVPLAGVRDEPDHLSQLEAWMRSYKPEELFDARGRLIPELAALAPTGNRRMGANPHTNGGRLLVPLELPPMADYAVHVQHPATERIESTGRLGMMLRDIFTLNAAPANFRLFCPDETNSNRLSAVFAGENRCLVDAPQPTDDHVAPDGRVMEVLSEHSCEGWLEGYLLTGRHGLFATYEAFAMVAASMVVQHAKWLQESRRLAWRAPVASLNILLTSTAWRNDHNGFSHQGPGLIDVMLSKKGAVARIYLPPDANCLLAVADHCLRSRDYVNLIVIDKYAQLQWLNLDEAVEHCARGASVWPWASNCGDFAPDIVLACAGDAPTLEVIAAAWWLRHHAPELRVRVVNVVDLMALFKPDVHPHGLQDDTFEELFTAYTHVIFAFHGYQRAIHEMLHGRPDPDRFHVRGFTEEGTTTTPFDMVVRNNMSRYHLCIEALRRSRRPVENSLALRGRCRQMLAKHEAHILREMEDLPEIRDWKWSDTPR